MYAEAGRMSLLGWLSASGTRADRNSLGQDKGASCPFPQAMRVSREITAVLANPCWYMRKSEWWVVGMSGGC